MPMYAQTQLSICSINNLINTSYGYLSRQTDVKGFSETFDYPDQQFTNPVNSLFEQKFTEDYWQWEGFVRNDRTIGKHSLSAVMGMSLLQNQNRFTRRSGTNFTVNTFDAASFDKMEDPTELVVQIPSEQRNTTMSYYARVNYNYD